jgi:hypothetical protein
MNMKYIVAIVGGKEAIFVFPKEIDHDRFYEGLAAIRFGHGRDWTRRVLGRPSDLVAAGFVDNGHCWGRSETLKIGSRGEQDTALLPKG